MVIRQGDVFWVDVGKPFGSGPGYRHPHVVVQSDPFNESNTRTTLVCMITSNTRLARFPGNVPLSRGEGDLPKRSVVNVTQLFTVDKAALVEKIGTLSPRRVREVLAGITLVLEPRRVEP